MSKEARLSTQIYCGYMAFLPVMSRSKSRRFDAAGSKLMGIVASGF